MNDHIKKICPMGRTTLDKDIPVYCHREACAWWYEAWRKDGVSVGNCCLVEIADRLSGGVCVDGHTVVAGELGVWRCD